MRPEGPKKIFLRPDPPLSQGLDDRSPPLSEGVDPPLDCNQFGLKKERERQRERERERAHASQIV